MSRAGAAGFAADSYCACLNCIVGILRRPDSVNASEANPGRRRGARRAGAAQARARTDAFRRETFALPREQAREKAREVFRRFPKPAYMTEIESWRELPDGRIEFTMRRLPTAD